MKCPSCDAAIPYGPEIHSVDFRCPDCGAPLFISGFYSGVALGVGFLIGAALVWPFGAGVFGTLILAMPLGLFIAYVLMRIVPRVVPPELVLYDRSKMLTTLDLNAPERITEELPAVEEAPSSPVQKPKTSRLAHLGTTLLFIYACWGILHYARVDSQISAWILSRLPKGTDIAFLVILPFAVLVSDVNADINRVLRRIALVFQLVCVLLFPFIRTARPIVAYAMLAVFCAVALWVVPEINKRLVGGWPG